MVQQALLFLAPGPRVLPPPLHLLGLPLAAAGVLLHAWAWRHFRRRGTPLDTLAEPPALVTDGPFRLSRNPMYLGGALILSGLATLYATATPWLVPPAFLAVAWRAFVRPEERLLALRFGGAWHAYRARVGRWAGPVVGPGVVGSPPVRGAASLKLPGEQAR